MSSLLEIGVDSMRALVAAGKIRIENESIYIPRTSLAIFVGLRSQFPREIKERGEIEALRGISYLSPLMIALNEMADIGISVHLRNETDEGSLVVEKMQRYLRGWKEKFLERFPGHKDTITNLINDFCLLSLVRNTIGNDQIPTWLELDSAIFEEACFRVATQKLWSDNVVYKPQSFEDLERKYGEYLIRGVAGEKGGHRLSGLHGMEMALKVTDDRVGIKDDRKLGLPSFAVYAEDLSVKSGQSVNEILEGIMEIYRKAAIGGGISDMTTHIVWALCHFSSLVKGYFVEVNAGKIGQSYIDRLPEVGEITTVLRHTLLKEPNFVRILK